MISASDRENAVLLINEAIASGASCKKACWTVWIVNFNTSHVTVYHNRDAPADVIEYNFNTSHVTVYRKTSVIDAIRYAHFNTSHVTVYQQQWIFPVSRLAISIHLMLRFIAPDLMHP